MTTKIAQHRERIEAQLREQLEEVLEVSTAGLVPVRSFETNLGFSDAQVSDLLKLLDWKGVLPIHEITDMLEVE